MPVLAFESSCDETAVAVTEGNLVLAELVRSQVDLHQKYGGVVPEIASRAHLEALDIMTLEVMKMAGLGVKDLCGLAVTLGPGLVGALLVAVSFAKGLSLATGLPLTGVNHVKAHALAPFLREKGEKGERVEKVERGSLMEGEPPSFPLVALVVSGGHTSLFLMEDFLTFRTLGKTLDDAAGEAFDKSAKLMGFGYPGGGIIEKLAMDGNPEAYKISRPMLKDGLNFSFSGIKTRVLTLYEENRLSEAPSGASELKDLAASFQAAVVEVLTVKLLSAIKASRAKGAVLAGGVAANGALRREVARVTEGEGLPLYCPKVSWCADNAAMIGFLGSLQLPLGVNILNDLSEPRTRWTAEEDL